MLDSISERLAEEKAGEFPRLKRDECLALFRSDDLHTLGRLGREAAERRNGNSVFYVHNRHINPTNLCVNRCRFCAFSRSRGEEGAFELTVEEILEKLRQASTPTPLSEVHIVGGLHPDWPFERYLEIIASVRREFPDIHIKGYTATEVEYMSRISGRAVEEVLERLKDAGLNAMPGGGAEIFSTEVRNELCPEKLSSEGWLSVMEKAHRAGIGSNATMLFGHRETFEDRVDHLLKLRELQDRTGGFQAFIPLAYHPDNTDLGGGHLSGTDCLKTIAASRLILDNIPHIKAYWVMLGQGLAQLALCFGADDLEGTVIEEHIAKSAGGPAAGGAMSREQLRELIERAGREAVERDGLYRPLSGSEGGRSAA